MEFVPSNEVAPKLSWIELKKKKKRHKKTFETLCLTWCLDYEQPNVPNIKAGLVSCFP